MVACLKDKYLGAGIAAAASLARNRGDEVVHELVDFALDHDGTYRRDVGVMLGTYAREAGIKRLLEVLNDDQHRRSWLVALDALAEIFKLPEQAQELKVA